MNRFEKAAEFGSRMGKLAGLGTLAGIGLSRSGILNAPDAAVGAGAGALIGGDTPTPSKGFGKASGLATMAAARILGRIGTATADMYGIDKNSPGLRALAGAGTAGVIGGGLGALGGYIMPPSVLTPVMGKNKKPKVDKEGNPIKEETQLSKNQGALMIGGGLGIGGLLAGGLGGYLSNYR